VLIWAAWQRRWRLLAAFGLTFGVLVLLPLPWLPDWPLKWLAAAGRYAGYTVFDPPLVMLTGSNWSAWALAGLLLAWMGWRCWRTDRCQGNSPAWAMSLLIVLTALIAPRTSQANQLVLLLPLFLVFSRLERAWIVALVEVVLVAGLWLIDATMLPPVSSPQHVVWQHRIISPILPLGLALALLVLSPRPTPGEEK
jgi:magnesium-transporting ATPase (P-type)